MPFNDPFSRAVLRAVLIVLGVVGALALIWLLRRPIGWIILALFLAVALSGPVNALQRRLRRRGLAIAATYLLVFLIPVGLLGMVLPSIITGVNDLADEVPTYVERATRTINENARLRQLNEDYGVTEELQRQASQLPGKLGGAAGALTDIGVGLINSIFAAITIIILSIFMVGRGRTWVDAAVGRAPHERQERLRRTLDRIASAVGNYVRGALLQATVAGLTSFIVLKILGVPFAGALAIVIALLDMIPLVGASIGAVLVGLVTLFHDFPTATIIWAVWAVIYQQVENTVIQPRIQARAVNVQPFVVLVSVLFGSALFGITGALLAIPMAAAIQISLHEWGQYREEVRVETMIDPDAPGTILP